MMSSQGRHILTTSIVGGAVACLALAFAGCAGRDGPVSEGAATTSQAVSAPLLHGQATHDPSAPQAFTAPAGAHLTYMGGRVVSNMQVVQVIYGSGNYLPQVTSTASPSMATFYEGVLNSPYVDWLSEYDTTAPLALPRTNQVIGRGSFSQQVTITPSAANNGATIDDVNIQAELSAQIQAGTLPAPTHDAAGNNNTYYAVFFPHGKVISLDGSESCVEFCAYHGTIANAGGKGEIYYGVHPDMQQGSGCEGVCGMAPTVFGNYTQVASHEMMETITDSEVGLATVIGPPSPGTIPTSASRVTSATISTPPSWAATASPTTCSPSSPTSRTTASCRGTRTRRSSMQGRRRRSRCRPRRASGPVTDGQPPVTTTWSKVSGPGTVTFGNAAALATTASFSAAGVYVLELSAVDSLSLTGSATVQITVDAQAQPPVVNAGTAQTITLPASASLSGSVTDGQPPVTTTWSKVSGPGTVTFGNAAALATTASFSAAGVYVLELSAVDSLSLTGSATVQITVDAQAQPPVVNAGTAQTITLPASASLSGSVSDGQPPVNTTWSNVCGTGTVTFGNAAALATNASLSAAGVYVLEMSAVDSLSLTGSATVQITVDAQAQPPVVNAGTAQTVIALPASAAQPLGLGGPTGSRPSPRRGPRSAAPAPSPSATPPPSPPPRRSPPRASTALELSAVDSLSLTASSATVQITVDANGAGIAVRQPVQ